MAAMQQSWGLIQKLVFRFFCAFFLLYIFPFPLNILQYISSLYSEGQPKLLKWYNALFDYYDQLMHAFIPWVGKHILHLPKPVTVFTNGSGDTTYDYLLLLTFFVLALVITVAWTLLDRKRPSYNKAYYWLRVLVRYNLGLSMFVYGFAKVYHLQMPFPSLPQLVQPFGEKSPMGLAWSFIGYSAAFSAFTGWSEVAGGILLFFRRTTALGALTVMVVMTNVVAINFCYDVPVKLFSSMLLLMSVFLLAPDAGRLWDVLYRNRATQPVSFPPVFTKQWKKNLRLIVKIIIVAGGLGLNIYSSRKSVKEYGDEAPRPHYYGIYNTQSMVRNSDTIPPLTTDTSRWKRLIIQHDGYASVYLMNDSVKTYIFKVDSTFSRVTAYDRLDTLHKSTLSIRADSDFLFLAGMLNKDSVKLKLKKQDVKDFRLVSRGFHWINEFPLNR